MTNQTKQTPRTKRHHDQKQSITIRIHPNDREELIHLAREKNTTKSNIFRLALASYIHLN